MEIKTIGLALGVTAWLGGAAVAQETPEPMEAPEATAEAPAPEEAPEPMEAPAESTDAAGLATPCDPAAEEDSLLEICGSVGATYNHNLMDPVGGTTRFHSYTAQHSTFLLNQAHLAVTGSDARFAYAVEIDAGTDAVFNTLGASYFDVQEAYVAYRAPSGLGVKAGKFATFNGIEVIEAPANPTITRGFLFGLAEPATHVGALLTYQVSDQLDVALGAVNGWDLVVDNNRNKTIVGKVGVTTDKALLTISSFAGKERNNSDWRATLDATALIKLAKVDLWLQGNVGFEEGVAAMGESGTWMGFGIQPVARVNDKVAVGARLEVFVDGDGARTAVEQTLVNVSVAPAYQLHDRITLRGEGRLDFSTEDVFVPVDGDPGAMQVIVSTEMLLTF